MGLTHTTVKLRSLGSSNGTYEAEFLVDTGATDSLVPSSPGGFSGTNLKVLAVACTRVLLNFVSTLTNDRQEDLLTALGKIKDGNRLWKAQRQKREAQTEKLWLKSHGLRVRKVGLPPLFAWLFTSRAVKRRLNGGIALRSGGAKFISLGQMSRSYGAPEFVWRRAINISPRWGEIREHQLVPPD